MRNILIFLVAIALPLAAGFLGSGATMPAIPGWYAGLVKPLLNPPSFVFAPVWTLLYVLMGIASYRIYIKRNVAGAVPALLVYGAHLLVNLAWSLVFFGAQNIEAGVMVIIALWLMIVSLIVMFSRIDKIAGWLLVPYLLWVTFATYLNVSIAFLN